MLRPRTLQPSCDPSRSLSLGLCGLWLGRRGSGGDPEEEHGEVYYDESVDDGPRRRIYAPQRIVHPDFLVQREKDQIQSFESKNWLEVFLLILPIPTSSIAS